MIHLHPPYDLSDSSTLTGPQGPPACYQEGMLALCRRQDPSPGNRTSLGPAAAVVGRR